MKLTHSSRDTGVDPGDWFTGDVYSDSNRNPDDPSALGCAHVSFTPGARTAWHRHPKGQTNYVTDGIGYISRRGGTSRKSILGRRCRGASCAVHPLVGAVGDLLLPAGSRSLIRSTSAAQARKASSRWAYATTAIRAASPIANGPTRCAKARLVSSKRELISWATSFRTSSADG